MSYGYIRPSIKDIENPDSKLMDKVIDIIGDCFDYNDDAVQLQVLKAFLTAVSSVHCDVHDRALVNAIRACFNIFLVNRNRTTQTTAKGTLTQMLGIIFKRFEQASTYAIEEKARASREGYEMTVELSIEEESDGTTITNEKNEEIESSDDSGENSILSSEEVARSIVIDIVNNSIPNDKKDEKIEESEESKQGKSVHVATGQAAVQIAYNDCSGIFKALCKLSSKELPAS